MAPSAAATTKLAAPASYAPDRDYCSWGNYPRVKHEAIYRPEAGDDLPGVLYGASPSSLLPY
jgi:hypothetical protein